MSCQISERSDHFDNFPFLKLSRLGEKGRHEIRQPIQLKFEIFLFEIDGMVLH